MQRLIFCVAAFLFLLTSCEDAPDPKLRIVEMRTSDHNTYQFTYTENLLSGISYDFGDAYYDWPTDWTIRASINDYIDPSGVMLWNFYNGALQAVSFGTPGMQDDFVIEFHYNGDGLLSKVTNAGKVAEIQWNSNGDIASILTDRIVYTFKYDKKKNPLYHLPIPMQYPPFAGEFGFAIKYFSPHNVTSYKMTYASGYKPMEVYIDYDYVHDLPRKADYTFTDSLSDNILKGDKYQFRYEEMVVE